MKKLLVICLLCAAAVLTACGSTETEDNETVEVVTTTSETTTTTTYATTTTKSTTTKATTTTKKATTTTEKLAPPPGNDPNKGYGQAFELNGGAVTTRATTRSTTRATTKAATKAPDIELKPSVRIDQMFSGLRDRAAEAAEAARIAQQQAQQAQQAQQDSSSSSDESKTDDSSSGQGKDEDDKGQDSSSSAEPAPQPTPPAPQPEKAYPKEYVATNFADFKGYMSYHYQKAVVDKYIAMYPESFFKSKVLALNTVAQAAGRTCELTFKKAACPPGGKVTTIDMDRNELPNAEKVSSTNLIQAAFDRSQYQQYASGGIKWRFTFKKYYKYPLAAAKLDQVGWDLKKAFQASCIKYYRDMPKDADHTTEWYANYAFTNNKGNCYAMAAMFCEMARTLGYKCEQISGKVPLMRGGYGPHSWVEITVGGKVYVCDPDFQAETGLNGYLINYGQKWTWRYEKITVMK